MRVFQLVLLASGLICASAASESCHTSKKDCESETNYELYMKCVQDRKKREIGCQNQDNSCDGNNCDNNSCQSCDCDSCSYGSCANSCNDCCSRCCNVISSCTTNNCCYKTCHTNCRDNGCRNSCKKSCREVINKNTAGGGPIVNNTIINNAIIPHNITTIIHLNNMINNTNLINVPIHFNHTNYNNFTAGGCNGNCDRNGPEKFIKNQTEECCTTIGPKRCVSTTKAPFVRCFHIRKRVCGAACLAPIVHYAVINVCDNPVKQQSCQQQSVYVPQPQPRCAYQQNWPYVSCGGRAPSCEGCYSHYSGSDQFSQCSSFCYDDGYGVGPYYRQGPFYRPGYAHVPSCYQTGYCNDFFYNGGGFGGGFGGYPSGNGIGYPPASYDYGFIVDENTNGTYDVDGVPVSVNNSWNVEEPILNQGNGYPYQFWPPNFVEVPRDVRVEASVQSPRSTRFAEIKIKSVEEESVEMATENTDETTTA